MTIPLERSWAIKNTQQFLWDLLDPKRTPRIPLIIRRRARSLLKHFPQQMDIEHSQKQCPEIWGEFKKEKE